MLLLRKSHVKEHERMTLSGALAHVHAYDDKRPDAAPKVATHWGTIGDMADMLGVNATPSQIVARLKQVIPEHAKNLYSDAGHSELQRMMGHLKALPEGELAARLKKLDDAHDAKHGAGDALLKKYNVSDSGRYTLESKAHPKIPSKKLIDYLQWMEDNGKGARIPFIMKEHGVMTREEEKAAHNKAATYSRLRRFHKATQESKALTKGRVKLHTAANPGGSGVHIVHEYVKKPTTANALIKMVHKERANASPVKVELKQKRAKAGGEHGANGEWYKGGAFIATEDIPKKIKEKFYKTASDDAEAIDAGRREVPPLGQAPIVRFQGLGLFDNGAVNERYLENIWGDRPDVQEMYREFGRRWAAGERLFSVYEFPEMARLKDFARMALAGMPIPQQAVEMFPPEIREYFKIKAVDKLKKSGVPAPHSTIDWNGIPVVVENHRGTLREWHNPEVDEHGITRMKFPYGYIRGVMGADGDELDVFIGPDSAAQTVYVVKQLKAPDFKRYDEDKVMLGFPDKRKAVAAYMAHYDDPRFFGGCQEVPVEGFVSKLSKSEDDGSKKYFNMVEAMRLAQAIHAEKRFKNNSSLFTQFCRGLAVEMEHIDTVGGDKKIVAKIALDHLTENPRYYEKLDKEGL